jgi:hypothetical protein
MDSSMRLIGNLYADPPVSGSCPKTHYVKEVDRAQCAFDYGASRRCVCNCSRIVPVRLGAARARFRTSKASQAQILTPDAALGRDVSGLEARTLARASRIQVALSSRSSPRTGLSVRIH